MSKPASPNRQKSLGCGAGSASIHEAAGRRGALPSRIKPVAPSMRVQGPAYPVHCPPGDNLWLHRAIVCAGPGAVLVVDVGGAPEFGYWGEVMSHAARARGLAGLVIDGGVRDGQALTSLRFPVFSNGICIRGTSKDPHGRGTLAETIMLDDISISAGDLVVGDADGVVVIPAADSRDVMSAASRREHHEVEIIARLASGETTFDVYGLPT